MSGGGRTRSERWRARRRLGLIPVIIDVAPKHRRALERMGLIAAGYDENREALAWAVTRFLDAAPAVQEIGDALYPNAEGYTDAEAAIDESATVSPAKTGQTMGIP